MLDKVREQFHNLLNAIDVFPPNTTYLQDQKLIPPISSVLKELAIQPTPSSFFSGALRLSQLPQSSAHQSVEPDILAIVGAEERA